MKVDYDTKKFYMDKYGVLYPKNKTTCNNCRMRKTCPAKGVKCNNYEFDKGK